MRGERELLLDALDRLDRLERQMAEHLASVEDRRGDGLLTAGEAAALASCHVETVLRATRRGDLPARRVGRAVRIALSDFEAWLSTDRSARRGAHAARTRPAPSSSRRPLADALVDLDTGSA